MYMDHESPVYGRGNPVQRRTCVLPRCHWRSPRTPAAGSSQNSHALTVHWILATMMPLSDGEKVAPSHHALGDVPGTVLLDRIRRSW
jgi:hypothetical protein